MLSINFTLVIFAVSFIIFLGLMRLIYFDRVATVINKREAFIDDNIKGSQSIQQQIEQQIAESDSSSILAAAKQDAQKVINSALESANAARSEAVSQSSAELKSKITDNINELEQEKQALMSNLDSYVREVVAMATDTMIAELKGKKEALT